MDAGARQQVWNDINPADLVFRKESRRLKKRGDRYIHPKAYGAGMVIGSDQAWISYVLGPKEHMWDENDGVLSHRDESLCPDKLGRAQVSEPSKHARIVFFHGVGDPSQPETQRHHPWIKDHWL